MDLGVTFFRFPETQAEREERYLDDRRCWCGDVSGDPHGPGNIHEGANKGGAE